MEKKREPLRYRPVAEADSKLWREVAGLDKIVDAGCYVVQLKHGAGNDELPLPDCNQEHYIVGTLIVTESGTENLQKNRIVGQTLILPQCGDGNVAMYSRSYNNLPGEEYKWSHWISTQQNTQVGQVTSLDGFTQGGIYSGVYMSQGSSLETFVLTVIDNDVAATASGKVRSISQFKNSLLVDGTFSYKTRVAQGNGSVTWGNWVDLGAADTTDIQDNSITVQKLSDDVIAQLNKGTTDIAGSINDACWSLYTDVVNLDIRKNDGTVECHALPASTVETAGVMSAKDKETLGRLSSEITTKVPIRTGKNLFNKESAVLGMYIDEGGKYSVSDTYFYSQPIEVREGISYYFSNASYAGRVKIMDALFNVISLIEITTGQNLTMPKGGSFVQISGLVSHLDICMVCQSDMVAQPYEPYTDKSDIIAELKSIGRTDNFYGDFVKDVFIESDGRESVATDFYTTPFIQIHGASYIDCYGQFGNTYGGGLSFYDVDKNFLYRINESSNGKVVVEKKVVEKEDIRDDAFYVRLTTYVTVGDFLASSYLKTDAFGGKLGELDALCKQLSMESGKVQTAVTELDGAVAEIEKTLEDCDFGIDAAIQEAFTVKSRNLFDKSTITKGYYLDGGAVPQEREGYFYSDLIPVSAGETYYVNKYGEGAYYHILDVDNRIVEANAMGKRTILIPSNGKYIRLSTLISNVDTMQFEKGTEETAYEDFYEYNIKDKVLENTAKFLSSTYKCNFLGADNKQ